MALSGVEIFKMLPKTNCKKCGFPTCLAFAMKLAQRQTSLDLCPDVSDQAKRVLGEASAPPVRPMTIGTDDRAVKLGEETVLFRHEKRFVNPAALAVHISDTLDDAETGIRIDEVLDSAIDRVGQRLRIDALFLSQDSGDDARFIHTLNIATSKAPGMPLILHPKTTTAADDALKISAKSKPVLYGANEGNADVMAEIAKRHSVPLGVSADGLEKLVALTEKITALGVRDLIIDPGSRSAGAILRDATIIRRAAVRKNFKPLGFPVITFAERDNPLSEAMATGLGIEKYASIIVTGKADRWKNLALFTLRQNIYTDPQVPMQVEQKVYPIGDPGPKSPLMITTNFSLTFFIVSGEVENSRVPSRLAVMDCEGLSVLTAWAAGKFTAAKIAQFIRESGIENEIETRELIIPGYLAILSGALEERLPGWTISIGPREANALPAFLRMRAA